MNSLTLSSTPLFHFSPFLFVRLMLVLCLVDNTRVVCGTAPPVASNRMGMGMDGKRETHALGP